MSRLLGFDFEFVFRVIAFTGETVKIKLARIGGFLGTALAGMMLTAVVVHAADQKPNVVFILADNVGYGDLGPYGGGELRGYATPRSDQLAARGCASRSSSSSPPALHHAPRS
jgi:hypothetical protein